MKKQKSTKRALLVSGLSLLMCVSMLVGSTFAWFTDSVASGINQIVAGNLDVEVYFGKEAEPTTNKVTDRTDLFTDAEGNAILWEPGAVAYTNLNVVNEGTLALKYQFAINFTNENNIVENNAKLSQVLKVAFVDSAVSGTREEILNIAKSAPGEYLSDLMLPGTLEKETNKVYGVIIYWEPSAEDNTWNVQNGRTTSDGQPLHIDLGLKLIATQAESEFDSFDKDYDADARFPAQDKPLALVTKLPDEKAAAIQIIDLNKNPIHEGVNIAYSFQPTETYEQALASEYSWAHADFYVYASEDVPADSMILAGYYSLFGEYLNIDDNTWIGLSSPDTVYAGEEHAIRLLKDGMGLSVAYNEICNYGNDGIGFLCGAADCTGANQGTTITVELRLYEVTCDDPGCHHNNFDCETGEYVTAGTFKYTFQ